MTGLENSQLRMMEGKGRKARLKQGYSFTGTQTVSFNFFVQIGNHVWLGEGVKVLENTVIPDNCVVGARSVISRRFQKTNCVMAENPATVVKEGIFWDRRRPKQYLLSQKKK